MPIAAGSADTHLFTPVAIGCFAVLAGRSGYSYDILMHTIAIENGGSRRADAVRRVAPFEIAIAEVFEWRIKVAAGKDDNAALTSRASVFGQLGEFFIKQRRVGSVNRDGPPATRQNISIPSGIIKDFPEQIVVGRKSKANR